MYSRQKIRKSMEWMESWNFRKELMMKELKISKIQNKVKEIFDSYVAFLKIVIGRKKYGKKNLNVDQLQKWWHEVYSPTHNGPIIKDQLEDATIYISNLDRDQGLQFEWEKALIKYEEELRTIKLRIKFIPFLDPDDLDDVLSKVKELSRNGEDKENEENPN